MKNKIWLLGIIVLGIFVVFLSFMYLTRSIVKNEVENQVKKVLKITISGDEEIEVVGSGTMRNLPQFKATSSPYSAITTRTHAKDLYMPYSWATTSGLTADTMCLTGDSCITTWTAGGSGDPFAWTPVTGGNSTTTTLFLDAGFASNASSSISTLNLTSLVISGDTINDFQGDGLVVTGNALLFDCSDVASTGLACVGEDMTIDANGDWTGVFDGQEGSWYIANSFSTTSADVWELAQSARGDPFAWTPTADGVSTSTLLELTAGFISSASSTFSSEVHGITPTVGTHLANKNYVDDLISSAVDFFLTDTASDITDQGVNSYVMQELPSTDAESSVASTTLLASTDDQLVFVWAIASSTNPFTTIPTGSVSLHFHAERTAGSGAVQVYFELYKRDASQVETLLVTSEISSLISTKEAFSIHGTNTADIELLNTDRLLFKVYTNTGAGAGKAITFYQEGTTDAHGAVPALTAIFSSRFLRLDAGNSPTANIDWGGFNLSDVGTLTASGIVSTSTATFVNATTTHLGITGTLNISGDLITDFNGAGLDVTAGVLTLDATGAWGGTLTSFGSDFYTFFNATNTDALSEGSSNLYSTQTNWDTFWNASTSIDSITTLANLSLPAGQITGLNYYTDADVSTYLTGGTGITESGGAISFDCSEVEGTGINCSGEAITLDATGNWSGTFDLQEGSWYIANSFSTTSADVWIGQVKLNELAETSLADPNADEIVFWDDGGTTFSFLDTFNGIVIDGTALSVTSTTTLNQLVEVGTLTGGATGAGFTINLDSSTLTCTNCIDIGDNTNLSASVPLKLTGDAVSVGTTTGSFTFASTTYGISQNQFNTASTTFDIGGLGLALNNVGFNCRTDVGVASGEFGSGSASTTLDITTVWTQVYGTWDIVLFASMYVELLEVSGDPNLVICSPLGEPN